jgi:Sap, sulfolipid-1-addressing protein
MASLIPRLIVTGLAASISPVAVMVLISVLSTKSARRNSLVFLLAFTLTLIAIGLVAVYIFHVGGSGGTSKVDGYIDLSLGILCLLAIILEFRKGKKQKSQKVAADLSVKKSFSLGCVSMLVNSSTVVIYISGLHVISAADLTRSEDLLGIAILTLFTLTTLLIPMAIYFVFPSRSERALASFKTWLAKHSKVIGAAVLLIFGVYLIIKGARVVF